MKKSIITLFFLSLIANAQNYWQQEIQYKMDVSLDHEQHLITGTQDIVYTNNSPDTLDKIYIHLYWNAFQPGSMMDVRSRTIADPDGRVKDRISKLKANEIGTQEINALIINGKAHTVEVHGTLAKIKLLEPLNPGSQININTQFQAQVPVQIRRSGRDNAEGIDYTMTQWYPKVAEYDVRGWNATPYVGREFHGVWGSFDVNITLASKFIIGGTGTKGLIKEEDGKKTWKMYAAKVHDFAWAADPDFIEETITLSDGIKVNYLYQKSGQNEASWSLLKEKTPAIFTIAQSNFGKYDFPEFSFIQAGDGGMEYPMCTMMLGNGEPEGLVGLGVHELMHSWYQGMLATNEALYPWMDEGFTTYAEDLIMNQIFEKGYQNHVYNSYYGCSKLIQSETMEALSTHADKYHRNRTYGISSYSRGAVFLMSLNYIMGKDAFERAMLRYYDEWSFKHPTPQDFIKCMEAEVDMELDWFLEQYLNRVDAPNQFVSELSENNNGTRILLESTSEFIMPLDVFVVDKNGNKSLYYIPVSEMYGIKTSDTYYPNWDPQVQISWDWTNPYYVLDIPTKKEDILSISLDATTRLFQIDEANNYYWADYSLQVDRGDKKSTYFTIKSNQMNAPFTLYIKEKNKDVVAYTFSADFKSEGLKVSSPNQQTAQIVLPIKWEDIEAAEIKVDHPMGDSNPYNNGYKAK